MGGGNLQSWSAVRVATLPARVPAPSTALTSSSISAVIAALLVSLSTWDHRIINTLRDFII